MASSIITSFFISFFTCEGGVKTQKRIRHISVSYPFSFLLGQRLLEFCEFVIASHHSLIVTLGLCFACHALEVA